MEDVIRLAAGDPERDDLVTGKVVLVLSGEPVHLELTIPSGQISVQALLPIVQGLSSLMAERASRRLEAQGKSVSCRAGCGACCRQLVPISAPEARALGDLVSAMPEPRQTQVRQRFADALAALGTDGLIERHTQPGDGSVTALGMDYFRAGIACPFLEDDACSIHPDRPLSCREYLVSSPPLHCANPSCESIERLVLESHPSLTLLNSEAVTGWMPLVVALSFAEQAAPAVRDRDGSEILRELISQF